MTKSVYIVKNYGRVIAHFDDPLAAEKCALLINASGGLAGYESADLYTDLELYKVHMRVMVVPDDRRWRTPIRHTYEVFDQTYVNQRGNKLTRGEVYWGWFREPQEDFGTITVFGTEAEVVESTLDVLVESLRTDKATRLRRDWLSENWKGKFDPNWPIRLV